MTRVERLFDYVREQQPRALRGLEEARAVDPSAWEPLAERFLGWAAIVLGEEGWCPRCADAYARFSSDVIMAQARYEADGHYEFSRFADCNAAVYSQRDVMDDYLWGVYLTNFLWPHHVELSLFFRDRFISRLPADPILVEIAPGHGGWGIWALSQRSDARLEGYDISPSSIAIASSLAVAAGVADRAAYTERDALDLTKMPAQSASAVICSFLIEHLEQPDALAAVIAHLLPPGGRAYLAGALTAAQVDHIYEFRKESELVSLCERHGLRVLETLSTNPRRMLPKARFVPRSMGLILVRQELA
jgi:SAM-dependent methyltransferase